MKRWLALILVALLIWGISQNPVQSADTAGSLGGTLADMARGIGTFFHDIAT